RRPRSDRRRAARSRQLPEEIPAPDRRRPHRRGSRKARDREQTGERLSFRAEERLTRPSLDVRVTSMLIIRMHLWISNAPAYVADTADFCGCKQVVTP